MPPTTAIIGCNTGARCTGGRKCQRTRAVSPPVTTTRPTRSGSCSPRAEAVSNASPWWGSAAARWRAMRNPVTTGRSTRSIHSWSVSRAIHAYFTYLQNSRGRLNVVLGDGRLTLQTRDTRVVRPDRPGRVQLRRHTGSSSDTRSGRTVYVATHNRWRRRCPHLEPIPEARTRPRGARTTAMVCSPSRTSTVASRWRTRRRGVWLRTGSCSLGAENPWRIYLGNPAGIRRRRMSASSRGPTTIRTSCRRCSCTET